MTPEIFIDSYIPGPRSTSQRDIPPSSRRSYSSMERLCGVDQAEDVVENEVAAVSVGLQLEELGIAHGLLLLINLFQSVSIGAIRG